jgi:DNA-3-methyladenine glycosylase I
MSGSRYGETTRQRCVWVTDALLMDYHDNEWGRPPVDDARWLEMVILETFQAGLSWRTVLHKREAFREAFANFEIGRVAAFDSADVQRLLTDKRIIRNRRKIEAAIENARIAQRLTAEFGSLSAFFYRLRGEDERVIYQTLQRTFRHVGPTTAESIAFATGLVPPPHDPGCWLAGSTPSVAQPQ